LASCFQPIGPGRQPGPGSLTCTRPDIEVLPGRSHSEPGRSSAPRRGRSSRPPDGAPERASSFSKGPERPHPSRRAAFPKGLCLLGASVPADACGALGAPQPSAPSAVSAADALAVFFAVEAFFAAVFFAVVFFAAVFFAGAFLAAVFLAVVFFAVFLAVFLAGPLARFSAS